MMASSKSINAILKEFTHLWRLNEFSRDRFNLKVYRRITFCFRDVTRKHVKVFKILQTKVQVFWRASLS